MCAAAATFAEDAAYREQRLTVEVDAMQQARLMRSESDKMLAGVCGGLADYLNVDPVLVRLAFVVLFLASGIGLAI